MTENGDEIVQRTKEDDLGQLKVIDKVDKEQSAVAPPVAGDSSSREVHKDEESQGDSPIPRSGSPNLEKPSESGSDTNNVSTSAPKDSSNSTPNNSATLTKGAVEDEKSSDSVMMEDPPDTGPKKDGGNTTESEAEGGKNAESESEDGRNTSPTNPTSVDLMSCVKVFELATDGKWSDKGTGVVECIFVEPKDSMCLVVRSDKDNSVLMNSTIRSGVNYVRQQDTLIVWTEMNGQDLALSFQEAAGCTQLWDALDRIRKRLAADKHDIDQMPESRDREENPSSEDYQGPREIDLPDPELGNIKYCEEFIFRAARSMFGRELLLQAVERTNFIRKLLPIFETAEDLEDTESLYALANIVRSLIFLNESALFELILSDELFIPILGILECECGLRLRALNAPVDLTLDDREFPTLKAEHRQHFLKSAKYKEIVPIRREEIKAKIQQTYRVQYLKDVALARLIDDGTFSALLSMTFFNQVEILHFVRQDDSFLKDLFQILSAPDTPEAKKRDAIFFLQELCAVTKSLQSMNRGLFQRHVEPEVFYRTLINHGIFDVLSMMFSHEDVTIRTAVTAITAHLMEHDANIIRSLTQAQVDAPNVKPFVQLLIERLLEESDTGLRSQYAEMLRTLLDTAPLDMSEGIVSHLATTDNSIDNFLQLFYDNWVSKLISPLIDMDVTAHMQKQADGREVLVLDQDLAGVCNHICELLCFMVKQHAVRCPYLFTITDLAGKVALLLKAKDAYLRLSALRVFRVCVGMKDVFWHRMLVKKDVFKYILEALLETRSKYNLLNSACLDLFEFVRKENLKTLLTHIVMNHRKQLEQVAYVDTMKSLILRYEQNIEPPPVDEDEMNTGKQERDRPQARDGWHKADESEEAYFNMSDDDEDESANSSDSSMQSAQDLVPKVDAAKPIGLERRHAIEFVRATPDFLPPLSQVGSESDEDEDDLIGNLSAKRKVGDDDDLIGSLAAKRKVDDDDDLIGTLAAKRKVDDDDDLIGTLAAKRKASANAPASPVSSPKEESSPTTGVKKRPMFSVRMKTKRAKLQNVE
ncbi:component of IIS longevity pathway SMK-1-domain-containing protein [Phlyctochytrium arcticum]|nr:component of IIS longevity pathway SMK-1-domain-containing protein [Phlyctochytrium arcticum]